MTGYQYLTLDPNGGNGCAMGRLGMTDTGQDARAALAAALDDHGHHDGVLRVRRDHIAPAVFGGDDSCATAILAALQEAGWTLVKRNERPDIDGPTCWTCGQPCGHVYATSIERPEDGHSDD